MADERTIEELRSRAPGVEPEDPYNDIDIDALPEWWQRAIEEFKEHDLRPYRPPRFEDAILTHEVVSRIEREFGVDIGFGSVTTNYREEWTVCVDGESVGTVGRHRSSEGYTVYEIKSTEFESVIRGAIDDE